MRYDLVIIGDPSYKVLDIISKEELVITAAECGHWCSSGTFDSCCNCSSDKCQKLYDPCSMCRD